MRILEYWKIPIFNLQQMTYVCFELGDRIIFSFKPFD